MTASLSTYEPDNPKRLLLVVEDEQIVRDLLCEAFESEDFVTLSQDNADLALDSLNLNFQNVALLLADINMPESLDGADLARSSMQRWPEIPVLVMSGFESLESVG